MTKYICLFWTIWLKCFFQIKLYSCYMSTLCLKKCSCINLIWRDSFSHIPLGLGLLQLTSWSCMFCSQVPSDKWSASLLRLYINHYNLMDSRLIHVVSKDCVHACLSTRSQIRRWKGVEKITMCDATNLWTGGKLCFNSGFLPDPYTSKRSYFKFDSANETPIGWIYNLQHIKN